MVGLAPLVVPVGYDEVKAVYGDPAFRDLGGGQLVADPAWERANLIRVNLFGYDRPIAMHRIIAAHAREAFVRAATVRPDYKIRTVGCFNPRCKKKIIVDANGKKQIVYRMDRPSMHAFAIAFDINPDTNKFGKAGDIPIEVAREFEALGFIWGGRWPGLGRDDMHFQFAKGC